jgi:hypothetical protein
MAAHQPAKWIWTDNDFDAMGWHDATLWAMLADPERFEFLVDLDYIFEWVKPAPEETYYKFWIAPVTMIFENAHTVKLDIESSQGTIEVADLHRENPRPRSVPKVGRPKTPAIPEYWRLARSSISALRPAPWRESVLAGRNFPVPERRELAG